MKLRSLRTRLILIILAPLLLISVVAALWQFKNTTARAEEIFDRGLLSAALAISRDVALSGGDALSPATRRIVTDTSGGELFYHVFAPDGVFITGYATPPVSQADPVDPEENTHFYDATYLGSDVRVLRFQDAATLDGVSGLFTITVWQASEVRTTFIRDVILRALAVIGLMVLSVAAVVWFGVGIGLRPLLDLQDAIAQRTPSELESIRRDVPKEVQGIVRTLNTLLDRVSRRISSKDEFISNAAHQLRNPIASVLALAEAVENAPSPSAAKTRSAELVLAARDATHLTNQLLSFERARGDTQQEFDQVLDLWQLVEASVDRFEKLPDSKKVNVNFTGGTGSYLIQGDPLMLQEAILNLLMNVVVHGGSGVSKIDIKLVPENDRIILVIEDDGCGIDPSKLELAMARFGQADAGFGSGLGLPIAQRIIDNHSGTLQLHSQPRGLKVLITLPAHSSDLDTLNV